MIPRISMTAKRSLLYCRRCNLTRISTLNHSLYYYRTMPTSMKRRSFIIDNLLNIAIPRQFTNTPAIPIHFLIRHSQTFVPSLCNRTFVTAQKYQPSDKKQEINDQLELRNEDNIESKDNTSTLHDEHSTPVEQQHNNIIIEKPENVIEVTSKESTNHINITSSHSNRSRLLKDDLNVDNFTEKNKSVVGLVEKSKESNDKKKPEITASPELIESKLKSEELPSGIQRYFFLKYFTYLNKFQQSLENEMPDTFQMFRIFSAGLKEFIIDIKDYIGILLHVSLPGDRLVTLSRRELELYYHMPRDMIRVFPVLAVSSIPLGQNVAFPIAYWFPRILLCRHFWRQDQKFEFATLKLKKRLFNARPVFRSLQVYLDDISDGELQNKCQDIFFKLGSGIHPELDEILELLPLFKDGPYQLADIRAGHLNALLCLHGRSALPFRKSRLRDHAYYLNLLDNVIRKEGVDTLSTEKLTECLFIRGINPLNLERDQMLAILNDWLYISKQIRPESFSLLLHLPIFLAYNHPTNLSLIS